MRDLTVSEIEMVSGGDDFMSEVGEAIIGWFTGIGAAIQNALNAWSNGTPNITSDQRAAITSCIQAGGTTTLTQSGGSTSVAISAPTRTVTMTHSGGTSSYSCVLK